MSEFLFQNSQRVVLPADVAGAEGVQGVVVAYTGFIGREPEYKVQSLVADTIGESGALKAIERRVSESELSRAQPPLMVRAADLETARAEAYRQGGDDLREELKTELQSRIAKRKAARTKAGRQKTRKRR